MSWVKQHAHVIRTIPVLVILLAGGSIPCGSQTIVTFEKAMEFAVENSPDIRRTRLDLERNRELLKARQAEQDKKIQEMQAKMDAEAAEKAKVQEFLNQERQAREAQEIDMYCNKLVHEANVSPAFIDLIKPHMIAADNAEIVEFAEDQKATRREALQELFAAIVEKAKQGAIVVPMGKPLSVKTVVKVLKPGSSLTRISMLSGPPPIPKNSRKMLQSRDSRVISQFSSGEKENSRNSVSSRAGPIAQSHQAQASGSMVAAL